MKSIETVENSVREQRMQVLDAIRAADMRAYTVEDSRLHGGLLDFPAPRSGPSFVWTGFWRSAETRRARTTPTMTIATAPRSELQELHDRLRLRPKVGNIALSRTVTLQTRHGVQASRLQDGSTGEMFADFEDGDTAITLVVRDLDAAHSELEIAEWPDRESLVAEWTSLFD